MINVSHFHYTGSTYTLHSASRNSKTYLVHLPRRAENFGIKSLYRDISTVDMGGEGGSQKKCEIRDVSAELWFEKPYGPGTGTEVWIGMT